MIEINYRSRVPIYEQIAGEIKQKIIEGSLKPKEQIPSIRELANTLGVNPNTVKKSYTTLENQKLIETYSTKGTFITDKIEKIIENEKEESLENIKKNIEILKKMGVSKEAILERVDNLWQV